MTGLLNSFLGAGGGGGGGGGTPGDGTVTVDIYNPSGYRASAFAGTINTEIVTATPSFGTPPYSYLWTQDPDTDADFTPVSPTAAATAFKHTAVIAGDTFTADFICTVTDSNGNSGISDTVSATVSNFGDLSGL